MALPPVSAAPMPAAGATPPDDMGGMPDTPADDAADSAEPEVIATICKNADGTYSLIPGDEPEPGEGDMAKPTGESFPTPQALMKGLMLLLNDGGAAEDSFAAGFKGEPDPMPTKASPAAM